MMNEKNEILFSCPIFKMAKTFQTGRSGKKHARFVIQHPGGVGILPVLPNGQIILIRQFRVAVGRFIYEIPAGMKEEGENSIDTARRELKEETGYTAREWVPFPSFYASPGYLTEKIDLFLATELTSGDSALEDGENLSLFITDLTSALKMIESGEIEDAKTIIALLNYEIRQKQEERN